MAMSLSYGTSDYVEGGVITAVIVCTFSLYFGPNFSEHLNRFHSRISGRKDHGLTTPIVIPDGRRPPKF